MFLILIKNIVTLLLITFYHYASRFKLIEEVKIFLIFRMIKLILD